MTNTPQYIVIHHTASPRDTTTVKAVNEFHRTKDWDVGPGVAKAPVSSLGWHTQYHYFIEANGRVTQCAQESEVRWHAGSDANTRSIAICLAGWFDDGHDSMPTAKQVDSLKRLVQDIQHRYGFSADRIKGHRSFMQKTCPGTHLSDSWLKSLALPLEPVIDPSLGLRLAGKLLLAVEGGGAIWYVTDKGTRGHIGRTPEDVTAFLAAINAKKIPALGISNADLAKIKKV